jgi:cytochrome P450
MLWRYELAFGDTLSGLAGTYLGGAHRWKEIWDVQPDQFRWTRDPDKLMAGEVLNMPDEAKDNLLNWIKQGKPATIKPGELPPETIAQKGKRYAPYIAGAAAVGVIGYLALR